MMSINSENFLWAYGLLWSRQVQIYNPHIEKQDQVTVRKSLILQCMDWCPKQESNPWHLHYKWSALPSELFGHSSRSDLEFLYWFTSATWKSSVVRWKFRTFYSPREYQPMDKHIFILVHPTRFELVTDRLKADYSDQTELRMHL